MKRENNPKKVRKFPKGRMLKKTIPWSERGTTENISVQFGKCRAGKDNDFQGRKETVFLVKFANKIPQIRIRWGKRWSSSPVAAQNINSRVIEDSQVRVRE